MGAFFQSMQVSRKLPVCMLVWLAALPQQSRVFAALQQPVGLFCGGVFPAGYMPFIRILSNITISKPTFEYHYSELLLHAFHIKMDCPAEPFVFNETSGELDISVNLKNSSDCLAQQLKQDPTKLSSKGNKVWFDGTSVKWHNGWGTVTMTRPENAGGTYEYREQQMDIQVLQRLGERLRRVL